MGSSTENSGYGPTHNPWDLDRIPGGSGGGSSASLAAFEAPLALGTDTGGSIRQPASVTGTVGVKPTYGGVSRYGIIAMASSLDQAGPCARSVLDAALLHEVIGGYDLMDSTSIDSPVGELVAAAKNGSVKGLRIGVVKELGGEGYAPGVEQRFHEAVQLLVDAGAELVEVSCPNFVHALATYYLIMPAEVSSNLARFDGMRYGMRAADDGKHSVEAVMRATREQGFGKEVKRRVILGTYALSAGYRDAFYGSAQKVRRLIANDFDAAFQKADVLVSPSTPTTAFRIGERMNDPLAMYKSDLCTIPSNLAGNASGSIPCGLAPEDGLPVGFQIMAPALGDALVYRVGAVLEGLLQDQWGGPLLAQIPALPRHCEELEGRRGNPAGDQRVEETN
jgi:aspartyl-tRNA(Asn)/glutamyl-tRNA(Gln) amidotransferase subunit A